MVVPCQGEGCVDCMVKEILFRANM